jgi:hypothetical protein
MAEYGQDVTWNDESQPITATVPVAGGPYDTVEEAEEDVVDENYAVIGIPGDDDE